MVFRVQKSSFQEEIRSLMILWLLKHILIVEILSVSLEILVGNLIDPKPMILRVVCVEHY
jgi:polyferredoxin